MPRFAHRAHSLVLLLLFASLSGQGCVSVDTCDTDQYYLAGTCAPCPDDATATGDGCECADPAMEFDRAAAVCRLSADAAVVETDADAAVATGGGSGACDAFCGFVSACLGDNDFVQQAGADAVEAAGVVDGDDSACRSECAMGTQAAADAADDSVLGCIEAGAQSATCDGKDDFGGADEALTIIDGCCLAEPGAGVCTRFCAALSVNPTTAGLLDACK